MPCGAKGLRSRAGENTDAVIAGIEMCRHRDRHVPVHAHRHRVALRSIIDENTTLPCDDAAGGGPGGGRESAAFESHAVPSEYAQHRADAAGPGGGRESAAFESHAAPSEYAQQRIHSSI